VTRDRKDAFFLIRDAAGVRRNPVRADRQDTDPLLLSSSSFFFNGTKKTSGRFRFANLVLAGKTQILLLFFFFFLDVVAFFFSMRISDRPIKSAFFGGFYV